MVGDDLIHKGKAVTPNQFAQSFARTTRNAWTDLYIRRPEDQQFKLAHRLRMEQASQTAQPRPATTATTAAHGSCPALADASLGALIAAVQAQVHASQTQAAPPPPLPAAPTAVHPDGRPRATTPGEGWNLPERRKYRFRLEDIAFE